MHSWIASLVAHKVLFCQAASKNNQVCTAAQEQFLLVGVHLCCLGRLKDFSMGGGNEIKVLAMLYRTSPPLGNNSTRTCWI